jgi:ABC-type dipeptide/oligopeptide/nickel transport system permease subunit
MTGYRAAALRRRLIVPKAMLPVSVIFSLLVLALFVAWLLFPGLFVGDPSAVDSSAVLTTPGSGHPLGTDQLGRDVIARIAEGARTSVTGPLALAAGTTVIAAAAGMLAGYLGGLVDTLVSRFIDVLYSIPSLLMAIIVGGITGGNLVVVIAVLIVFDLPATIQGLRAAVVERVHLPYMEAARTLGVSRIRIFFGHLLPVVMPFILVTFFVQFTYGVVSLSSLSFIGFGTAPGTPDWGRMVAENQATTYANVWATAGPAIAIMLLALATNVIGEWVNDRYERMSRMR